MRRHSSSQLFLFQLQESILLKTVLSCRGRLGRSKRPELEQAVQGEEQGEKDIYAQHMHELDFSLLRRKATFDSCPVFFL